MSVTFSEPFLEPEPGTIVAWVPIGNQSEPPEDWVICDGREITEGEWAGMKTPNLTDTFLIGRNRKQVELDGEVESTPLEKYSSGTEDPSHKYKIQTYNVVYIMRIKHDLL